VAKLRDDFAIPSENEITSISRYLPQAGDVLYEGGIKQGNKDLLQYVIEEPNIIPDNRFKLDGLSWIIPND
jgi:hypothetical protein